MHDVARGRLVYLVGASGAGKDALLAWLRARLPRRVLVAHRYITRPAGAGAENHVALGADEFASRDAAGLFALAWEANGLRYGVGVEVDAWLARGFAVVVNGSRAHLPAARARYPDLLAVRVTASAATLAARLAARGREDGAAITARLARAAAHDPPADEPGVARIANDGPLEVAGERLVALVAAAVDATG